eukprot:Em0014g857a
MTAYVWAISPYGGSSCLLHPASLAKITQLLKQNEMYDKPISGDFKEARLRQKEDSPSSSDDGSTARKKSQSCNSEKDVKPMDRFATDDGIDLLSIKAVDPSKYALNLMSALFTDEKLGSLCYKKRPESKPEKPPLSPSRIALLEECIEKKYGKETLNKEAATIQKKCNQKCLDTKAKLTKE